MLREERGGGRERGREGRRKKKEERSGGGVLTPAQTGLSSALAVPRSESSEVGSSEPSRLLDPLSWSRRLLEFRLQDSWDELAVFRLSGEEAVSCLFCWTLRPQCWTSRSSEPEEWEIECRDDSRCGSVPEGVTGSSSEWAEPREGQWREHSLV